MKLKIENMLIDFVSNNDLKGVEKSLKHNPIKWNDDFGYSALHIAISKGFDDVAIALIKGGIDVNLNDPKGQTALHYCAFYGNLQVAKEILEYGGKLDIQDRYGNQPLWTAVFNDYGRGERQDIIELFVMNGSDTKHKNNVGLSPYDIVIEDSYTNLYTLFNIK